LARASGSLGPPAVPKPQSDEGLFAVWAAADLLGDLRKMLPKRHKNFERFFFGQAFAKPNRLQTNLALQSRLPMFATSFPS